MIYVVAIMFIVFTLQNAVGTFHHTRALIHLKELGMRELLRRTNNTLRLPAVQIKLTKSHEDYRDLLELACGEHTKKKPHMYRSIGSTNAVQLSSELVTAHFSHLCVSLPARACENSSSQVLLFP